MKSLIKLFLFFSLIFSFEKLTATHIVGGVIYYEHLGGRQYKVTFKVYRDCIGIAFDGEGSMPTFTFGIFEEAIDNNIFPLSSRQLPLLKKDSVKPNIVHTCLTANNSCVQEATYIDTIELPDSTKGYTIIYQRCCRNNSILNIVPQASGDFPGGTNKCYIPPTATYHNSSPVFRKFPPIFICRDQMFYFDHGATDKDGDVLRYSLTNALAGLSNSSPATSFPTLADNLQIPWLGPYSTANVLGGTPALTIDSITGFMYAKPNTYGRFIVAVMIKEYRGNVLMDSMIRDFQFNVVECDIPKADVPFVPGSFDPNTGEGDYIYTFCDTFQVLLKNTSTNAVGYIWDFGDPVTGVNNTSTDFEPIHVYSDTGQFRVKLIAYKIKSGDTCWDSTIRNVIVYPRFRVNFGMKDRCSGDTVRFTDSSSSYYGASRKWIWDFGNGKTDSVQNPVHVFKGGGNYNVKLYVEDSKGCRDDSTKKILIYHQPQLQPDTFLLCLNQSVTIPNNATIPPPYSIKEVRWKFLPTDSLKPSITYTNIDTNRKIKLIVTSDSNCVDSTEFLIKTYPFPRPQFFLDSHIIKCQSSFIANIKDSNALSYIWTDGNKDSIRTISNEGKYLFSISYPCETVKDSFLILKNKITASFVANNDCEDDTIDFKGSFVQRFNYPILFKWKFGNTLTDTLKDSKSIFQPEGNYLNTFIAYDTMNCADTITKPIIIYPKPNLTKKLIKVCLDVPTAIGCGVTISSPYFISSTKWFNNGLMVNDSCNMIYTTSTQGSQYFKIISTSDKGCVDSIDSIQVKTYTIPNPKPTNDSFILKCTDSTLINIVDTLAIGYLWDDLSRDSIRSLFVDKKYKFTITYPCQVFNDSFEILKNKILPIFNANNDCEGRSILFSNTSSNKFNIPLFYKWDFGNGNNDIILNPSNTYINDGVYQAKLVVSDTMNCKDSISKSITIYPKPDLTKFEKKICIDQPIMINCGVTVKSPYFATKINWYRNDTLVNDSCNFLYTATTTIPKYYKIIATTDKGCIDSVDSLKIYTHPIPNPTPFQDSYFIRCDDSILFDISDTLAIGYQWRDGPKDSLRHINFPGRYFYTITYPCLTHSDSFKIGNDCSIVFPTAFTPNGDGNNDVFLPRGFGAHRLLNLKIFDRQGQLIYHTTNHLLGWDGTYKNVIQNMDSYFYTYDAQSIWSGQFFSGEGNFMLIR